MYTVKEVADLFKKDKCTIYRWIKQLPIDTVKISGSVMIPDSEVEELKTIGRTVAPNCNFSPIPKKNPRRKKGRVPLWER